MRDYRGDFEVHLTVCADGPATRDRFRAWCQAHGCKCVRIVLARGTHAEQPMATWCRHATTLPSVLAEAQQRAADLDRAALPVVRVKIEAAPHNAEVPLEDADAAAHEPRNYFEHHVKLRRPAAAPRAALERTCERHGAHLSRNAFREAAQGQEERFVTLRVYGVGRCTADQRLGELLLALHTLGEQIVEQEAEYCVYDSNLALDAGWLSAGNGPLAR